MKFSINQFQALLTAATDNNAIDALNEYVVKLNMLRQASK